MFRRINSITPFSGKPNCANTASKGVRSSQAISMTLSISLSVKFLIFSLISFLVMFSKQLEKRDVYLGQNRHAGSEKKRNLKRVQ